MQLCEEPSSAEICAYPRITLLNLALLAELTNTGTFSFRTLGLSFMGTR